MVQIYIFNQFSTFQSDILDVNTIFKDLATLVHDQGEMIDSIEANVESTHVRVQEGTEQLRQAETYSVIKSQLISTLKTQHTLTWRNFSMLPFSYLILIRYIRFLFCTFLYFQPKTGSVTSTVEK